jgi:hypothetical protein
MNISAPFIPPAVASALCAKFLIIVPQTSKSAVPQVSKPAGANVGVPAWKPAIQQVWKPAPLET